MASTYDNWKLQAPEDERGASDDEPLCDIQGCGQPAEHRLPGRAWVCDAHQVGAVDAGGTPGCAGGAR